MAAFEVAGFASIMGVAFELPHNVARKRKSQHFLKMLAFSICVATIWKLSCRDW